MTLGRVTGASSRYFIRRITGAGTEGFRRACGSFNGLVGRLPAESAGADEGDHVWWEQHPCETLRVTPPIGSVEVSGIGRSKIDQFVINSRANTADRTRRR